MTLEVILIMIKEIENVAVELLEIFDNTSTDILEKIPTKIINTLKNVASPTYKFEYNTNLCLEEQNLKMGTKVIIAWLYKEYICNIEEKKELEYKIDKIKNLNLAVNNENIFNNEEPIYTPINITKIDENTNIFNKFICMIKKILKK